MAKKRGNAKWIILSVILLIVIVSAVLVFYFAINKQTSFSFPFINLTKTEKIKPWVDPDIYKAFNMGWTSVGVMVSVNKPEFLDPVLKSLPPEDFKLHSKTFYFYGNITKNGIKRLENDVRVRRIEFNRIGKWSSNNNVSAPYVEPPVNFYYNATIVSVNKCENNKDYLVDGHNATIYQIFTKSGWCAVINYTFDIKDNEIYVNTNISHTNCIHAAVMSNVVSTECLELNMTLPVGEYKVIVNGVLLNNTLKINPTEEEMTYCDKDDDCIIVSGDCCDCTGGGKAGVTNKKYYNFWLDKFEKECKGKRWCPAIMSQDWTCSAEPKCVNGKCTLVK